MSKLLFQDYEYTFKELFDLHLKSPMYKEGDVTDLDDGEIFDIKNICDYKNKYFSEILTNKHKENIIKKINENDKKNTLEQKYKNRTIKKDEMLELLKIKNQDGLLPNYNIGKGYIIVNLNKIPENISDSDYGKFNKMLSFLSYSNSNMIENKNKKPIKKSEISRYLKFSKVEYFNKFLRRLKSENLLDEQSYNGIKYIILNPAYARKNMAIDKTIYMIFKDDLKEFLTDEQKFYLEMRDENIEIEGFIHVCD